MGRATGRSTGRWSPTSFACIPLAVKLAVIKESRPGEDRVAIVPEVAAKLVGSGVEVAVEAGAGTAARFSDDEFREAGATVEPDPAATLSGASIVARVQPPSLEEVAALPAGVSVISFLQPVAAADIVQALAAKGATVYSLDLLPRISRAQSMDALSSQATVGGYRAGLSAAEHLAKFFPMFMTAAGTVPPAKVLVMGAGVAGLQAIATARRLGAVVRAYDVRAAAKEEVQSLGATVRRARPRNPGRRRWIRQRAVGGVPGQATGAPGRRGGRFGCGHHHGADPRPEGTGPGDHGDGGGDVRGIGDRRHGCGFGRELRAVRGRGGRPPSGGHRGRDVEPAGVDAHPCQLPLRPEHRQLPRAAGQGRSTGPGLRGRDRGRHLRGAGRRRGPRADRRGSGSCRARPSGPGRPAPGPPGVGRAARERATDRRSRARQEKEGS